MGLYLLLLTTGALVLGYVAAVSPSCNYYQGVIPGQTYYVNSPNYPTKTKNADCRWEAVAPSNSKIILTCSVFSMTYSDNCVYDRFRVSPSGDSLMSDAHAYCGTGTFTVVSTNNRMVMTFNASPNTSEGGMFSCSLIATVPPTPPPSACDCGWKNQPRIVNGRETGVNEYPMMAGLVDFPLREIVCGTTVIARRYTLSAAHCVYDRQTVDIGVLIGDHDTSSSTETDSAVLLTTDRFDIYPAFNWRTLENDIAVIRVTTDIVFTLRVGPACLPFRYPTTSVGTVVNVVGWGTLEYTGPKSTRLMETQLDIVDINRCKQQFEKNNVSAATQLCTYRSGTDACQADSGGPLLWMGQGNRLNLVGVISYGSGCAGPYPGVNTRVYPYLSWIMYVTPGVQYCTP